MNNVLEKVYRASLKFLVPLTIEETYSIIAQEAMKFVNGEVSSILLEENGILKRVYSTNPLLYQIIPRRKGYMYTVFKTRKPIILTNKNIEKVHPEIKRIPTRSDILVPLFYRNKSIGVLTVITLREKPFTQQDLNILHFFSPMASLAIRKTQLYDETREALELRDRFISMAAHELRTPLTSVNGYIQLLRTKLSGADTVEARWIDQLYGESIRLTNLVNEFLEINRIKSGELTYHLKECSLKKIVHRSINNFRFSSPDRQLIFEDKMQDKKDIVIGDPDKILQVLNNILENAAKFSSSDKPIHLDISAKAEYFSIKIKDQGIGISKKDLPKVYEIYSRGSEHTKEGIGLGLFLVKDIIDRHHGTINIKSKPTKGTVIEIKLLKAKI